MVGSIECEALESDVVLSEAITTNPVPFRRSGPYVLLYLGRGLDHEATKVESPHKMWSSRDDCFVKTVTRLTLVATGALPPCSCAANHQELPVEMEALKGEERYVAVANKGVHDLI